MFWMLIVIVGCGRSLSIIINLHFYTVWQEVELYANFGRFSVLVGVRQSFLHNTEERSANLGHFLCALPISVYWLLASRNFQMYGQIADRFKLSYLIGQHLRQCCASTHQRFQ